MKRSPSMKGSRVSSAYNNNSVAVSEDKPPTPKTKISRMKNYADEQKNISKRQEQIDPQKLKEQNEKLKEQLNELVDHLDLIVLKKKEKRKQNKLEKNKKPDEPQAQRQILLNQEKQTVENAVKIKRLQKKLENTYQNGNILKKEDNIIYLQAIIDKLKKEIESQQKIEQKQTKGLDEIDYTTLQKSIERLKRDIQHEQKECRQINDDITNNLKMIQKLHNSKVTELQTIKQLEQKIKEKKIKPEEEITEEMVKQIEIELKDLTKIKEEQILSYSENLKKSEYKRNEAKKEMEKQREKLIKLEREYKINKVYIHEGNRYIKMDDRTSHRSTKPNLSATKKATTPSRNTPSPNSNLNRQPSTKEVESIKEIEIIKEEQFEETLALNQEQKKQDKPTTPITENIKEEEDQISIVEQEQQQVPAQQNNIYKKPMMMMKKQQ